MTVQEKIQNSKTYLGIEFGSTRIKAVLIDDTFTPIAGGSHDWENRYENGVWTYSTDDIIGGLQHCYASLVEDIKSKYGVVPSSYGAMGISGIFVNLYVVSIGVRVILDHIPYGRFMTAFQTISFALMVAFY